MNNKSAKPYLVDPIMKFYTSHQIDLHTAIADHGFAKADFSFTKKKGRIIANHNSSEATFSFMERRESKLDVQKMRVLEEFTYELVIDDGDKEWTDSWEVLLVRFNEWLVELS